MTSNGRSAVTDMRVSLGVVAPHVTLAATSAGERGRSAGQREEPAVTLGGRAAPGRARIPGPAGSGPAWRVGQHAGLAAGCEAGEERRTEGGTVGHGGRLDGEAGAVRDGLDP